MFHRVLQTLNRVFQIAFTGGSRGIGIGIVRVDDMEATAFVK